MSGGGSSAGEVAFPAHMGVAHADWLDNTGVDTMTNSVVDLMNTAQAGASPFAGWVTADPAIVMGAAAQVLTPFQAVEDLDALNLQNIFTGFYAILDDAIEIAAIVAAEAALLDTRMIADILPEFQRGMRDMGAVLTTGFTLGEANMRARDNLSVAKLDAELRLQSRRVGWQLAISWVQMTVEWNKQVATLATEVAIRYIEARFKADQVDIEMAAKDVLFDLETYQYGSNVMASISGAVVRGQGGTSGISAALGGVLSGAATGAAIGSVVPLLGTTVGASVGAALGLAAAIF
jgi:hypothetical protein